MRPLFTPVDLYRIGDSAGAHLDAVRPGEDIVVRSVGEIVWVAGTPNGGASVRASIYRLKRPGNRWWRLPAASPFAASLVIRNDNRDHWLIEPAEDMALTSYTAALRALDALFVPNLLRPVL